MEPLDIKHIAAFAVLIQKYRNSTIDNEELKNLEEWKKQNLALFNRLVNHPQIIADLLEMEEFSPKRHLRNIAFKSNRPVFGIRNLTRALVAASVLLLAATYLLQTEGSKGNKAVTRTHQEILPGHSGAVLTLSDGRSIVIDSLGDGIVAAQGSIQIVKEGGKIAYIDKKTGKPVTGNNTMSTPRGRQFQLLLPDGTKVWLNSLSSITYPLAFSGNERRVTITGEAYFEVVKDAVAPFVVDVTKKAWLKVLGTRFNVEAYTDEKSIKTTLLDGSLRVAADTVAEQITLMPGQQVKLAGDRKMTRMDDPDVDEVIAWKNGNFSFHDVALPDIMRNIARWYAVDISFADDITDTYTLVVSKDLPLSEILKYLEHAGGVEFETNGNQIAVHKFHGRQPV